jgi:multidrug efflux pump subunit AcrA (membrane-fusion protein)
MAEEQKEPGHTEHPPEAQPVKRSTLTIGAIVLVVIAAVIVITGIVPRLHARTELRKSTDELAPPTVEVARPTPSQPAQEISFPSNIQAFVDAPIYARTSGYVKSWNYDIGARVRKGALLAVIESPEVDQQLAQALADLQTAQANAHLADITAARYTDLLKSDSVSRQDTDNAVQQAEAQHATVASQQANVRRLQQLVGFERVYAPFDGVVTQRNTDVGQLVNSGNSGAGIASGTGTGVGPGSGSTSTALFQVSDIHTLRVFVGVPQEFAPECKPGKPAFLTLAEFPNRRFDGTIARTADSIDPSARTLNVEIDLPNRNGNLLPGAYATVHIPVTDSTPTYTLPVGALIFRQEGLRVALLDGNRIKIVPITPGRDFGREIEVIAGLNADSQVITTPPDSAIDGMVVRVVNPRQEPGNANQGSKPGGDGGGAGDNRKGGK